MLSQQTLAQIYTRGTWHVAAWHLSPWWKNLGTVVSFFTCSGSICYTSFFFSQNKVMKRDMSIWWILSIIWLIRGWAMLLIHLHKNLKSIQLPPPLLGPFNLICCFPVKQLTWDEWGFYIFLAEWHLTNEGSTSS